MDVCGKNLSQRGLTARPRVSTLIFVHIPEELPTTWKTTLDRAKEHRLEAYATLFSRLSSDLSEPSRELSACTRSDDATA